MFDRLWHLHGSVALTGGCEIEDVLMRLKDLLRQQHKRNIVRSGNSLSFDDPIWTNLGPNWSAMIIYDHGRLWIEPDAGGSRLHYDLRSLHAFVFCLFGATMFCVAGCRAGGALSGLGLAAVAFGWLYGMNILLSLARVPHIIRRVARRS
jgi:hypothetical protein